MFPAPAPCAHLPFECVARRHEEGPPAVVISHSGILTLEPLVALGPFSAQFVFYGLEIFPSPRLCAPAITFFIFFFFCCCCCTLA